MIDLLAKNKEMLDKGLYNSSDTRQMIKIDSLKNPNDYDLYLIVCALCNYDIPEKLEARELRMEYYKKTNNGNIKGFEHVPSDYNITRTTEITCTNARLINKYGHYGFYVDTTSREIISDLWNYKSKDCLKYVDNKTCKDKIIITIAKSQFSNFVAMLDEMLFKYDIKDISYGVSHDNTSTNTLIDVSKLDLPFELYPFQIEDANKIVKMKRAMLGHEMGTGKTCISLLVGMSIDTPKLVICPESLRLNWQKEIFNIHKGADAQILMSNDEFHTGKDWTIIGYKTASKFLEELKVFNCIFIDEAHNCKAVDNWGKPSSQRAKAAIELSNNAEYCYLLSGTPMPSHNKDLFNILRMLKCEKFDFNNKWAFKNFADKFCAPKNTYFGMDYSGNSNSNELHNILNLSMIRRLKKDVLPDLNKQRQFIPIAPKFKTDYKDIEKRLYHPKSDDTYMGLAMTGRKILSKYKLDTATDLADSLIAAGESVVIVTNFVETADRLVDKYAGNCVEIRGGMSDELKQLSIETFQSKAVQVCILSLMAGGVGITLTAANTMIIIDYAWLPSDMIQVEDRICRAGQDKACMIYYIYCDNSILDNIFIETISEKSENIDMVIDNADNTYNISEERFESSTYLEKLKAKIAETMPLVTTKTTKKRAS